MEKCTIWFASTYLRNFLSSFLLLTPPGRKSPSSTKLLREETQASALTVFPSPHLINHHVLPIPPLTCLTHLSLFLSLHCHSLCSDYHLSCPGKLQQPSNWYPYFQSCPFPIFSPCPSCLFLVATIYNNNLPWGDNKQKISVVFL